MAGQFSSQAQRRRHRGLLRLKEGQRRVQPRVSWWLAPPPLTGTVQLGTGWLTSEAGHSRRLWVPASWHWKKTSLFCALNQRSDPTLPPPHLWQQVLLSGWSSLPSPSFPWTFLPSCPRCTVAWWSNMAAMWLWTKSHHVSQSVSFTYKNVWQP